MPCRAFFFFPQPPFSPLKKESKRQKGSKPSRTFRNVTFGDNKRQNLMCNSTPLSFLTFLTLSHIFVSFNTASFLSTPALSSPPTRSLPSFLKVQLHSDLQMKPISKSLSQSPQHPRCNSQRKRRRRSGWGSFSCYTGNSLFPHSLAQMNVGII